MLNAYRATAYIIFRTSLDGFKRYLGSHSFRQTPIFHAGFRGVSLDMYHPADQLG